ncbi:MAG: hypothetical protein ACOY3K_05705 [Candidatus Omnitrophota bacterium]
MRKMKFGVILFMGLTLSFANPVDGAEDSEPVPDGKITRDPFQIAISASDRSPEQTRPDDLSRGSLRLEGIIWSEDQQVAVISGEKYRLGETKKGITLFQIRGKEVDIISGGETETLRLHYAVRQDENAAAEWAPLDLSGETMAHPLSAEGKGSLIPGVPEGCDPNQPGGCHENG